MVYVRALSLCLGHRTSLSRPVAWPSSISLHLSDASVREHNIPNAEKTSWMIRIPLPPTVLFSEGVDIMAAIVSSLGIALQATNEP
jgi:hypothetical protein